jgi:5-methylcytosine-specific restriction endonuclease McrA
MEAIALPEVRSLRDDQLTERLYELRRRERHLQVEFLLHLAELDRRKLVEALGYRSLFVYCTEHLGLTKGSAFRRTNAARLLARFPILAAYLHDGRLNLTTLVELRDVLAEDRLDEILARAAGRSEEQVKELVAALRPRPAPPEMLRKLPQAAPAAVVAEPLAEAPPPPPRPAPRLEPVTAELQVLRVTVDEAFVADLRAVRDMLGHQYPGGRLDEILHHCLRVTREHEERRRRGSGRTVEASAPPPGSRYVPVAVRDEVWRRDRGRCTFVGSTGHRCDSTYQLELHHVVPHARGGASDVSNMKILCTAHNLHQARQDFGAEQVQRAIAARQESLF